MRIIQIVTHPLVLLPKALFSFWSQTPAWFYAFTLNELSSQQIESSYFLKIFALIKLYTPWLKKHTYAYTPVLKPLPVPACPAIEFYRKARQKHHTETGESGSSRSFKRLKSMLRRHQQP